MNGKNILHQLKTVSGTQMMSYVLETADDKVIVIDGGLKADTGYLLDFIRNITGGALKIDAWILSHVHLDHIDAFMKAVEEHWDEMDIGGIYYNFPPLEFVERFEGPEAHTCAEFNALLPKFAHKAVIVHNGDRLEIGSEFCCEFLWEPDLAIERNFINNTSLVFRISIAGQTILMTGDLGVEAGRAVLAKYGDSLKSDFIEMAHHGQNGVEFDFYAAVKPSVCLWCTPQWLWDNNAGKGYNTHIWQTIIVRGWMEQLGVKHHFIEKDGTRSIELPF